MRCANQRLQCDELPEQGHVALRIMSIRATMDSTGGEVRLNRAPGGASRCEQAVGMVERDQRILLGVNQEDLGLPYPGYTHHFPGGMDTDRLVWARHQRIAIACAKQESSP